MDVKVNYSIIDKRIPNTNYTQIYIRYVSEERIVLKKIQSARAYLYLEPLNTKKKMDVMIHFKKVKFWNHPFIESFEDNSINVTGSLKGGGIL